MTPTPEDAKERERDESLDKTLADSFPASDPPSTDPDPPHPDPVDHATRDAPKRERDVPEPDASVNSLRR